VECVGSYELLGRLADTNSAQRWRGRDTALGRDVLVRRLGVGSTVWPPPRSLARVLTGLSHPNIVGLLDQVEADGQVWLIDESADGVTLASVLARDEPLTAAQAVGVVRGVLQGLAYVHNRRALHGDINPSTILLDARGRARLSDFGLPAPTAASRDFLSPEAVNGLGLSARSDVYSVAAVLALLLGRAVDPAIRPVLAKGLARDPTDRYLDAEQFLQDLEDAAEAALGEAWLADASIAVLVGPTE
jgi:eukaryotic-like serine/threonine-protein kinase